MTFQQPWSNLLASNAMLFGQQIDIVFTAFLLVKNKTNQQKHLKTSEVGNEFTAFARLDVRLTFMFYVRYHPKSEQDT